MPDDTERIRDIMRALGNICILADTWPKRKTKKLRDLDPKSPEAFYMLATICFDLARKMEYLSEVTFGFGENADRKVARDMYNDYERINKEGLSWEERANIVEGIVLERYGKYESRYDKLVDRIRGEE
jgi:hypothetical protein